MKVLQLHTRYRQRGGEDAVVESEANLLRSAGHEVRQVIAENPETPSRAIGALALSPWNLVWMRRLSEEVKGHRPDVAHVHNTWFAMSPAVLRSLERAGVPVVMTLHNYRLTCSNGMLYEMARSARTALERVRGTAPGSVLPRFLPPIRYCGYQHCHPPTARHLDPWG